MAGHGSCRALRWGAPPAPTGGAKKAKAPKQAPKKAPPKKEKAPKKALPAKQEEKPCGMFRAQETKKPATQAASAPPPAAVAAPADGRTADAACQRAVALKARLAALQLPAADAAPLAQRLDRLLQAATSRGGTAAGASMSSGSGSSAGAQDGVGVAIVVDERAQEGGEWLEVVPSPKAKPGKAAAGKATAKTAQAKAGAKGGAAAAALPKLPNENIPVIARGVVVRAGTTRGPRRGGAGGAGRKRLPERRCSLPSAGAHYC